MAGGRERNQDNPILPITEVPRFFEAPITYENLSNPAFVFNAISDCDILIAQPITGYHQFKLKNLRAFLKESSELFIIPFIRFNGFWDKNDIAKMSKFSQQALDFFPKINSIKDCDRWIQGHGVDARGIFKSGLDELISLEKSGDVRFVDYFCENYKRLPMFLDPWHPSLQFIDHISKQIISWLSTKIDKLDISDCPDNYPLYFRHYRPIQNIFGEDLGLQYDLDGYYRHSRSDYVKSIIEYEQLENAPIIKTFEQKSDLVLKYSKNKGDIRKAALGGRKNMDLDSSESIELIFKKMGTEDAEKFIINYSEKTNNPDILHKMADQLLIRSRFKLALHIYEKKNKIKETTWGFLNYSICQFKTGEFDDAMQSFEKSLLLATIGERKVIFLSGCKAMLGAANDKWKYQKSLKFIREKILSFNIDSALYLDLGIQQTLEKLGNNFSTIRNRLQHRLDVWYKNRDTRFSNIANLSHKVKAIDFAKSLNIPTPKTFFLGRDLSAFNPATLPESYVIKPDNGADSKGVMVVFKGVNKFDGKPVDKNSSEFLDCISSYVLSAPHTNSETKILIEEYMEDDILPGSIPLDYKVHCYGKQARFIQLINRNPGFKSQSFYDRSWNRIPHVTDGYPEGPTIEKPKNLDLLIYYSDMISSILGHMVRVDFYLSNNSVFFGEVTTYPAGGYRFTDYGNKLTVQLWEIFPDEQNIYD